MILALLLTLGIAAAPQVPDPQPAPSQQASPQEGEPETPRDRSKELERVHVLGASMSSGFGLAIEAGTHVTIADFLRLALGEQCGRLRGYGDPLFFQDPWRVSSYMVQKSLHSDPTLAIAVDFPFWYGYGYLPDCESRMKSLEKCFTLLERFECPILLGDFPDMSGALQGTSKLRKGKPMIDAKQIPDPACLEKLNARLYEWAAARENVRIFPLAFFVKELKRDRTFEFQGIQFDMEAKQKMLQPDLLHPTMKGTVAATFYVLHQMVEAGWIESKDIEWDPAGLEAAMIKSTEAAREKAAELRRIRKERRERKKKERAEREKDKSKDADEDDGQKGGERLEQPSQFGGLSQ